MSAGTCGSIISSVPALMSQASGIVQKPLCVTPSAGPLPISTSSNPERCMMAATFLAVSSNFGNVNQRSVSQIVRTSCITCSELVSRCSIVKSFETGDADFCPTKLGEPAAMPKDAVNHSRRVNMTKFCSTKWVHFTSKQDKIAQSASAGDLAFAICSQGTHGSFTGTI